MNYEKNLKIAIVGCVHGDEIVGEKIIEELNKIKVVNHQLSFFVAHPEAVQKKKRFLEVDLNRSFPGNLDGLKEERLAYYLSEQFSEYDIVFDIHATNSNIDSLAIITSYNEKLREILKKIPIRKVMLCNKDSFGTNALISHVKLGIGFEYGPSKSGENYKKILEDLKQTLINLKIFAGEERIFSNKELYEICGMYNVYNRNKFMADEKLKDFVLIQKGQTVGKFEDMELVADFDFYPLFTREEAYKEGFLMSQRKDLIL